MDVKKLGLGERKGKKEKFWNYKELDSVNTWRLFSCVDG